MRARPGFMTSLLTPSLVVGTLLSIVTSLLLFMAGVTDFGMSFVITLSGISLAAVVDVIDRNEYASLFKAPHWLRHDVGKFGSLATEVLGHGHPVLEDELKAVIARCIADVEVVASGRVERPADDTRMMLEMAGKCHGRIAATTNVALRDGANRLTWWESQFGRRYWDANTLAMQRGVVVDRVFIYEKMDDNLRKLADSQRAAGANVYLIQVNEVAGPFRINAVVWDDECCWEAKMDAYSNITANLFSYSKVDIKRLSEIVDTLILHAQRSDWATADDAREGPDTMRVPPGSPLS